MGKKWKRTADARSPECEPREEGSTSNANCLNNGCLHGDTRQPCFLWFCSIDIAPGFEIDNCRHKDTLWPNLPAYWSHGCHPACLHVQMVPAVSTKLENTELYFFFFHQSIERGWLSVPWVLKWEMLCWIFFSRRVPYVLNQKHHQVQLFGVKFRGRKIGPLISRSRKNKATHLNQICISECFSRTDTISKFHM